LVNWGQLVNWGRLYTLCNCFPGPPHHTYQKHNEQTQPLRIPLMGEGEFRNSDEKRDESVKFVLGLGCVDLLAVGFEKAEEIDDFAARVRKVPRA
jgi:hypothetical protein